MMNKKVAKDVLSMMRKQRARRKELDKQIAQYEKRCNILSNLSKKLKPCRLCPHWRKDKEPRKAVTKAGLCRPCQKQAIEGRTLPFGLMLESAGFPLPHLRKDAREERAKIVEYLRLRASQRKREIEVQYLGLALDIERGEHHK